MSSGVKGAAAASRVPIPSSVKKMIENIKEITGQNHSEDEIYAVLKECSMDPNETTQKLLLLDTFHEVKRKRDRRKENQNKEPAESKWKPGSQAKGQKSGRGNYSSRNMSHDVSGGRSSTAVTENAIGHHPEKGSSKVSVPAAQEVKKSETSLLASPITAVSNGPSIKSSRSINVMSKNHAPASASGGVNKLGAAINASASKSDGPLPLSSTSDADENPSILGNSDIQHTKLDTNSRSPSIPIVPASGTYFSSSDPVLLPPQDSTLPSAVGTVLHEARGEGIPIGNPTEIKSASSGVSSSQIESSNLHQKVPNDFQGVGKNQNAESLQTVPATVGGPAVSRPSSNYSNRSQVIGPQKVIPGKEWKPKSTTSHANPAALLEVSTVSVGSDPESHLTPGAFASEDTTLELQKQLEDSHISVRQHVIIPNHLHVPEAEKLGFCFGSFDASFGLDASPDDGQRGDKGSPSSDSSEEVDGPVKEQQLSNENAMLPEDDTELKYPDHSRSPSRGSEDFSYTGVEASDSVPPNCGESKQEDVPASHQHPVVHTSSNYNFGFMPPTLSSQLTPSESSESQAHDPRLPGFVQSFDPANYYAQFYHSGMDSDGRISPFASTGATNKYSGNSALASAQTSQSPLELQVPVPLVLPTVPQTPLVTQAAGVMHSSISATQQALPVFRQPSGVHLPHYPPNYFPYGPYFSPFYVPPPAIQQFLSNGAFPQQPQAGNLYPTPPGTTTKYPVSRYKQGNNTGSSTHIGVPGNYGPYGLSSYTSSSAPLAVTSTSDDLSAPPVKENNIYVGSQQSEGSDVWFATPGRDISSLQASSFYNLPQGQLAFSPAQPGHGAFPGIFHPTQAVSAATVHPLLQQSQAITSPPEMVGPAAPVYQQPQHTQLNWPSNY